MDVAQGVQSPHFSGCAKTAEHADRPPLWLPKKETQEPSVNLQTSEINGHFLNICESGATRRQHKLVLWSHSQCLYICSHSVTSWVNPEGDLQDGRGVRCGDHFPPHKYIKNTSTCRTTPTEHLLNPGRRPQTSPKARNSPCTWVGQKKKEKKRTKNRDRPAPLGGSCEGGEVSTH